MKLDIFSGELRFFHHFIYYYFLKCTPFPFLLNLRSKPIEVWRTSISFPFIFIFRRYNKSVLGADKLCLRCICLTEIQWRVYQPQTGTDRDSLTEDRYRQTPSLQAGTDRFIHCRQVQTDPRSLQAGTDRLIRFTAGRYRFIMHCVPARSRKVRREGGTHPQVTVLTAGWQCSRVAAGVSVLGVHSVPWGI